MCVCINAIVQTEANTHLENVNIWGSESGIQEFFVLFFLLFYQPEVTSKLKLEDLMGINQPSTGTSFGRGGHSCGSLSLRRNNEILRQKGRASGASMRVAFMLGPFEHQGLKRAKCRGRLQEAALPDAKKSFLTAYVSQ